MLPPEHPYPTECEDFTTEHEECYPVQYLCGECEEILPQGYQQLVATAIATHLHADRPEIRFIGYDEE